MKGAGSRYYGARNLVRKTTADAAGVGQQADGVEGVALQPVRHVDGGGGMGELGEACAEERDAFVDEGLAVDEGQHGGAALVAVRGVVMGVVVGEERPRADGALGFVPGRFGEVTAMAADRL